MPADQAMTAAEFATRKHELPESGRWHELHAGQPVLLDAPDDNHGNIVLNMSRAIAQWLRTADAGVRGYACHEVGILVQQNPDTVYLPAISFFNEGQMFAQTDQEVATEVPSLVVELASANDRRRNMEQRVRHYLEIGVKLIWIPDPFRREVQLVRDRLATVTLGPQQILEGGPDLPGFQVEVQQIFQQPVWWTRQN